MIVAVVAVGVVQAAIHQVIHMITVRNRFVAAVGTMRVPDLRAGRDVRRALHGVCGVDGQRVFVVVIAVRVVEVTFVQIIRVAVVLERGVAAAGAMDMFGMAMGRMVAHGGLRLKYRAWRSIENTPPSRGIPPAGGCDEIVWPGEFSQTHRQRDRLPGRLMNAQGFFMLVLRMTVICVMFS